MLMSLKLRSLELGFSDSESAAKLKTSLDCWVMEIHEHQKIKESSLSSSNLEEGKERLMEKQQQMPASSSPPSSSSSPSHEFSFSISLQTSSTDKTKSPSSFTIDLSPADDIFFHGHLLPLHLLSHLPVPPRCSTNSIESYALPIRDLLVNDKEPDKESSSNNFINCNSSSDNNITREKAKSKSFSLLGLRWRKGYEVEEQENKAKQLKRKFGFNFSHVLKRYARMVRPFLHFKGRRDDMQLHRQSYSFSGNLSLRNKPELRGKRGEFFSAPVSMRTSPTNSGVLLTTTTTLPPSTNDSTMEDLQAAIQAAIAHCKKSVLKPT